MDLRTFAILLTVILIISTIALFSLLINRLRLVETIGQLRYTIQLNENEFLKNFQQKENEFIQSLDERVRQKFDAWRSSELENAQKQITNIAIKDAMVSLQKWKGEQEFLIRQDAIARSQSVIVGKAAEHLLPYMPIFAYNPKEVRFIGDPIDLLIFDGINDGNLKEIIFLEVKTGQSRLSSRQKHIRDAIDDRRVRWAEIRVD